jgi:hypothetical protein
MTAGIAAPAAAREQTYLIRTLDASAQDPSSPGNLWVGSGIPATNFIATVDGSPGVELAMKAMFRHGADILPTYLDSKGNLHVEVPSGIEPGTEANPRAKWNWTFSVNASLPGSLPSLDDYSVGMFIDLDPSDGLDWLGLRLVKISNNPPAGTSGYGWVIPGNYVPVIGDDEGTSTVSQNSQNIAFYKSSLTDPSYNYGPGHFTMRLRLAEKSNPANNTVLTVIIDVVDP